MVSSCSRPLLFRFGREAYIHVFANEAGHVTERDIFGGDDLFGDHDEADVLEAMHM